MTETCPRRIAEFGPWEKKDGLDSWHIRDGVRTCSFCGSLHPDDFIKALEVGVELVPTDKTYKAYLSRDNTKFYYQHLSTEQRKQLVTMVNDNKVNFGYPGYWYVKPFFVV